MELNKNIIFIFIGFLFIFGIANLNDNENFNAIISPLNKQQTAVNTEITSPLDMFGRLRVSEPFGLFEHTNVGDDGSSVIGTYTMGNGTTQYILNESSMYLKVGTQAGDRVIRQSHRYLPYIAGKGQLVILTGNLEGQNIGTTKRVGSFDDKNGIFFELNGTSLNAVKRSSIGGVLQEDRIPQNEWNIDKMDGTGPSGYVVNTSKSLIFVYQWQWLGVGTIVVGLSIDGKILPVHAFHHSNRITTLYSQSANLPVRYEIFNHANTSSPSQIQEYCMSVASEGGRDIVGFEFSVSTGITTRQISERTPILAIQLNNTFNGGLNHRTARLTGTDYWAEDNNVFRQ